MANHLDPLRMHGRRRSSPAPSMKNFSIHGSGSGRMPSEHGYTNGGQRRCTDLDSMMLARKILRFGTLGLALGLGVAAPSACAGRVDDGAQSDEVGSAGAGAKDAGSIVHDASSVVPEDA